MSKLEYLPSDLIHYAIGKFLDLKKDIPVIKTLNKYMSNIKFPTKIHKSVYETKYPNEIIKTRETFLDNDIIKSEAFYSDGKLKFEFNLKDGLYHGVQLELSEDGEITFDQICWNGKKVDKDLIYFK